MPSGEPGNRLVVFTGMIGCSAHQRDSKPSSSAVRAMKPTSTRYAGSGTDTPTFMGGSSGMRARAALVGGQRAERRRTAVRPPVGDDAEGLDEALPAGEEGDGHAEVEDL